MVGDAVDGVKAFCMAMTLKYGVNFSGMFEDFSDGRVVGYGVDAGLVDTLVGEDQCGGRCVLQGLFQPVKLIGGEIGFLPLEVPDPIFAGFRGKVSIQPDELDSVELKAVVCCLFGDL